MISWQTSIASNCCQMHRNSLYFVRFVQSSSNLNRNRIHCSTLRRTIRNCRVKQEKLKTVPIRMATVWWVTQSRNRHRCLYRKLLALASKVCSNWFTKHKVLAQNCAQKDCALFLTSSKGKCPTVSDQNRTTWFSRCTNCCWIWRSLILQRRSMLIYWIGRRSPVQHCLDFVWLVVIQGKHWERFISWLRHRKCRPVSWFNCRWFCRRCSAAFIQLRWAKQRNPISTKMAFRRWHWSRNFSFELKFRTKYNIICNHRLHRTDDICTFCLANACSKWVPVSMARWKGTFTVSTLNLARRKMDGSDFVA